jgi:hypothetical protein
VEAVSVETLLSKIAELAPEPAGGIEEFYLDVPERLTLRGRIVIPAVAMAVLVDALIAKDFVPAGYEPRPGGRRYRYQRGRAP